ncbi:hypothetical protein [Candidatus Nitrosocosmicus franklandus]|uniref:Uncharacterized protein n=1 Tax=Candidatus Nitrosocosmicus franklandianus TaxID=1798806 RepID=A0A484I8N4_9ARCH|nr:hypothetical protein [Candidatus Nitrosocosmicus franklandus]VFJ13172.1 conserved exported protein of unknown function [Candidatus Nitrosocosmicus franklandus]
MTLKNRPVVFIVAIFSVVFLNNISPIFPINDQVNNNDANFSIPNQLRFILDTSDLKGNNSSGFYATQIIMACQTEEGREKNHSEHCPTIFLNDLDKRVESQLVLAIYSDLIQIYDENHYSCHNDGHNLGRWLFEYLGNLEDALQYATIHCGGSVYHGIFQGYFEGKHANSNSNRNQIVITDMCPMSRENVNWLYERDCIHGIGHGLAILYDYNTTAAVDRCREFLSIWAQSACSRGVFMENIENFIETGYGDFDTNDIYSPCNKTIEKFASQCYYYFPAYDLARSDHAPGHNSIANTFTKCDNVPSGKFSKYCYQGIGRLLETIAYANTELSIAVCKIGNQTKYHNDCLLGTLKTILKGYADPDQGFKYCSKSKLDFKALCYEIIGIWIKNFFHTEKVDLENECAKAPESNYIVNCINANQRTPGADVFVFEPL